MHEKKYKDMKRLGLGMALAVLLGACGTPSVEDFMDDPERLAETMAECTMERAQGKSVSERCRNAQVATQRMARNLMPKHLGRWVQ